jgi:hypothetical protein
MDSRNGDLYESRGAALQAGVPEVDIVEVHGSRRGIGRLRMAARNEGKRRAARRAMQRASRRANRS